VTDDRRDADHGSERPTPDVRQEVFAAGLAQQALLGSGTQNVYLGIPGPEPQVSIAAPSGQRDSGPPFRDRSEILTTLASASSDARVWVLHGLGGSGKSRLALEAAFQAQQRGTEVWWISAAELSGLISGMRSLGRRLGMTDAELEHEDIADVIWGRLAVRRDPPWLLVIDNADDPHMLASPGGHVAEGRGWLRPIFGDSGMVIVTSRDGNWASWGPWCRLIRVGMLSVDDGAAVLADSAGDDAALGGAEDARMLASRLGGLPLALKMAGAYLAESAAIPRQFADSGTIRTYRQYLDAIDTRDAQVASPSLPRI
jgi:NB-ARC domain